MTTRTAILTVRTDPKMKKAAQKAAKDLGVPLSTVINTSLRAFVQNPRIELEPLVPNEKTKRALRLARKEAMAAPVFSSVEEMFAELDK